LPYHLFDGRVSFEDLTGQNVAGGEGRGSTASPLRVRAMAPE
jgi:hypothetical protein